MVLIGLKTCKRFVEMKKIAFILLLLMGTIALGYAQDIDEYYTKEVRTRGIKQITEKSLRGWKTCAITTNKGIYGS